MVTALNVNPTRMELTHIKRRLVTAKRGHKLLKDKRDELVRQFILLIKGNRELRLQMEAALAKVQGNFALARAVMEPNALNLALLAPARQARISVSEHSILSVRVPLIQTEEVSAGNLPYGLAETSGQLDSAISLMADTLPLLLALAEKEKTASLLADEIQKTRRRVNALEYVMIPQLEMTIRVISMKLEENERGSLTRLMKVKTMLEERN